MAGEDVAMQTGATTIQFANGMFPIYMIGLEVVIVMLLLVVLYKLFKK